MFRSVPDDDLSPDSVPDDAQLPEHPPRPGNENPPGRTAESRCVKWDWYRPSTRVIVKGFLEVSRGAHSFPDGERYQQ